MWLLLTIYLLGCVSCSPTKMRSTEMRRNKTKCHLVRATWFGWKSEWGSRTSSTLFPHRRNLSIVRILQHHSSVQSVLRDEQRPTEDSRRASKICCFHFHQLLLQLFQEEAYLRLYAACHWEVVLIQTTWHWVVAQIIGGKLKSFSSQQDSTKEMRQLARSACN